ncbi:uncharacterized protein LOC131849259 [Achroia grisella]|uniref:uncharacterized protein LOC131849259 n=1 Tax=Achroia grisella TaxID=688607 RepID=UPI0027D2C1FF|nr:uncharacterized protein LOC131849259 [Achroia grisella]
MPRIRRFYSDDETGEVVTYHVNDETGEPVLPQNTPFMRIRAPNLRVHNKIKQIKFSKGYMTKTKKFESLKANIIAGSHTFSNRLLLIPAAAFFPNLACVLLMILEIFLHVQCHKKNKSLKDSKSYYRSPFHIITSVFCGVCRDSDAASKIGQLQDERRHRYDYIRGMAL